MKNILVISDNLVLANHFMTVAKNAIISSLAIFDFYFSTSNKHPEDLVALGMNSINLKDKDVCDRIIQSYQIVFSLHCKQIFPTNLVEKLTCINIHPGFNPYNRGWYSQVFSIINKKPTGATIHLIDKDIDHGAIIYQEMIETYITDTSLDVYERIIKLEKNLISKYLENIINGTYQIRLPNQNGNYNSLQDFKDLCSLDLESIGTLEQHIDLLRSLTHGNFKNGFIVKDGTKIYINIKLTPVSDMI